ncbi:Similar to DNAH10: Dynein heavy chain 10 [Cotesia congregata]|uniref:Axonemal (Homo sapiens) n=1 Tax=Cotesia congregata TaxID=51543 RepID=A0A8J2HIA0_COTCN|nr:Similar to DNAH10: Dynein heavy chain 10 [Cotesia congregata]
MNNDFDTLSMIVNNEENNPESVSSSNTTITSDYRILWMWNKIMKFFNLDHDHKNLFEKLFEENEVEENLMKFFNLNSIEEVSLDNIVLFFFKTYRNEIIQEEVAFWEENIDAIFFLLSLSDKGRSQKPTKNAYGKVEKTDEEKKKKGKKTKKGKKDENYEPNNETLSTLFSGVTTTHMYLDVDGDDEDNADLVTPEDYKEKISALTSPFAPMPGEEDKYILTQKVIDKVIEIPVIHMISGRINLSDPELIETNFFYFLKTSDGKIPYFDSQETCDNCMLNYIAVGSLNGNFLEFLNEMLTNVFEPLLGNQYYTAASEQFKKTQKINNSSDRAVKTQISHTNTESSVNKNEKIKRSLSVQKSSIKNENLKKSQKNFTLVENNHTNTRISLDYVKELLKYLEELVSCVQWNLMNSEDDLLLPLPKSLDLMNFKLNPSDKNMLEQAENIVINWGKHINKVLEMYKFPLDNGPTAICDHWHKRLISLSILVENLNSPTVKKIKSILNEARSSILSAFYWFEIELWKSYTEARDNDKFLFTVSRHFKLITESSNFQVINESFPSLLEGIKMIWILSKYFNTEEKMTLLLSSVSWQLCENVKNTLSVKELFRKPLKEIVEQTKNAYTMLKSWKNLYFVTRKSIELSEKGKRWEFDQNRLFSEIDYITKVCNDFNEIASVLQSYYNIFGPELKSIITDPSQIDVIVKRVDELILPISNADFNIFNKLNQENWDATMAWFYLEVASLQKEALFLIDDYFKALINAEQALEVLLKFKNFKTKPAIQECLLMKFDVIMQQFSKEINQVEDIFSSGKKNPPLLKYHVPIAGSIFWVRQLLSRLQGPVMTFKSVLELNQSNLKSLIFSQYLDAVKQMKQFEDMKFDSWNNKANADVLNTMKNNILKITPIVEIIHEAEMLEQLKFELPISMRDKSIQKDRLKVDIELTQTIIDQYNELMDQLDPADVNIPNYAAHSKKLLKNLESIIAQVNHIKKDLDSRIEQISTYNLITITDSLDINNQLLQCNIYFSEIKIKRTKLVNGMLETYLSITPILIKLESLVKNTTSGKSIAMQYFYQRYEQQIFTAFVNCLRKNLDILNILLSNNQAIFTVDAVLLCSEVVLRPSPNEINIIVLRDVKDMLEKMKIFPRWIARSCHKYTQVKETNSDGFFDFNFYEDIMSIQVIYDNIIAIKNTVYEITSRCRKYLHRWKKYSNLWRADKLQVCEKFVMTCSSLNEYDEKFTFYDTVIEEIDEWTSYYDIFCIRINLGPLLKSIKDHAQKWKQILGDYLITETKQSMKNFALKIKKFRSEIELVINNLDKFKAVLQTIADIKKISIQAIVQYDEYKETFKILKAHGINFLSEVEEQAYIIQEDWELVYSEALYRDIILETTKERFRQMTENQISDLQAECVEFAQYYDKNGPASVESDLDSGLDKVEEFEGLIRTLEKRRLDLAYAENLFNLLPTNFSIFEEVKQNFQDIKIIYSLYKTQKDAENILSKTSWSDLNFQKLINEIEFYIREFKKFPSRIQQLDIGQILLAKMEAFKSSVLLFVDLKHEAIRERHWKELMDKTGKHLDITSHKLDDEENKGLSQ